MKKPTSEQIRDLSQKVSKFIPILEKSLKAKINEADTRIIINDILEQVLGYDKYFEILAESMTGAGYADYVITINDNKLFVVEVKAITVDLKQAHVKQALNYAAREGIPWIILTNAIDWHVYKVIIEEKVDVEEVMKFNLLNMTEKDYQELFYISKGAVKKNFLDEYWEYQKALNPATFLKVLLSDEVIKKIKNGLRKESGYKITDEEIIDIMVSKIIRPEYVKKSTYQPSPSASAQLPQEIDLSNLSNALHILLKEFAQGQHLTEEDMRALLTRAGIEVKTLAPYMRGLKNRLGIHLLKDEEGKYYVDEYGLQVLNSLIEE